MFQDGSEQQEGGAHPELDPENFDQGGQEGESGGDPFDPENPFAKAFKQMIDEMNNS